MLRLESGWLIFPRPHWWVERHQYLSTSVRLIRSVEYMRWDRARAPQEDQMLRMLLAFDWRSEGIAFPKKNHGTMPRGELPVDRDVLAAEAAAVIRGRSPHSA